MSEQWQNRIVGTADVNPADLLNNPLNAKLHTAYQREAVGGSLEEYGWVKSVMASQRTNLILDGHERVRQALERGEATVPVRYVDLSEDEEAAILATFDPISLLAGQNVQRMQALMAQSNIQREALQQTLADMRAGTQEPAPPPARKKPKRRTPVLGVTLRVGPFVQTVPDEDFAGWQAALVGAVGDSAGAIVAEIRKRLGMDT